MFTTRRGLLVGAAVLTAAGCTRETGHITTSDADLTAALRSARTLAAAADTLGFGDFAEDHRTHAATLERLLKPNVVAEEIGELPADAAALAEAETAASEEAGASCLSTDSDYAVVLGEIAACRAAHAAVLA